jgi:hypothetical protein
MTRFGCRGAVMSITDGDLMKLWQALVCIQLVTALSGCAHQYLAVNTELVASLTSQPKPLDVTSVGNNSAPPLSTSNRIVGEGWTWQVGTSGVAMGGDFTSANTETICIEFQMGCSQRMDLVICALGLALV